MDDQRSYLIRLEGQAGEGEINATSPLRVAVVRAGEAGTVLSVCTDQSGLVGLIRHLHGLGFVLLEVTASSPCRNTHTPARASP
ncbi:MAG: hypothetical protein JXA93_18645 [Anaerolineae bacterium]|nr:hypothetical protein [Anaerolineae bacterium]